MQNGGGPSLSFLPILICTQVVSISPLYALIPEYSSLEVILAWARNPGDGRSEFATATFAARVPPFPLMSTVAAPAQLHSLKLSSLTSSLLSLLLSVIATAFLQLGYQIVKT